MTLSRRVLALAVVVLATSQIPVGRSAAPPAAEAAELVLGPSGGEAAVRFPFRLDADGDVYAKLLPTPWNPVVPSGASNGTVSADRSAGLRGWWVHLVVVPAVGEPADLGRYADGAATPRVALDSEGEHALQVAVRAPAGGGAPGQAFRVDLALVRPGAAPSGPDPAWTLRADLTVTGSSVAPGGAADLTMPLLGGALLVAGVAGVAAFRAVRKARPPQPWL